MKTYHLAFNHCERRVLEERRLRAYLAQNGYQEIGDPAFASLVIFLACGMLEEQSAATIANLAKKREGRSPLVVFGCYPSMAARLSSDVIHIPLKDPATLDAVLGMAVPYLSVPYPAAVDSTRIFEEMRRHWDPRLILPHASDVYSLLISNGCSEACSYCTIRKATGRLRSRPIQEIVSDLEAGLSSGFKLFRLQCENLGVYGKDLGARVGDLLAAFAAVPQHFEVDLPDLHPSGLLDSFEEIAALVRLGRVLLVHLPIQSANQRILKLMNRRYDITEVDRRLSALRAEFPSLPVGTDVIAGFPTETEAEFEDSLAFLRRHHFDWVYLHGYSPKQSATASDIGEPLPWNRLSARIARGLAQIPNVLCYLNGYSLDGIRSDTAFCIELGRDTAANGRHTAPATPIDDPTVDVLICAGKSDVHRLLSQVVTACVKHFALLGQITIVTDASEAVQEVMAKHIDSSARSRVKILADGDVLSPGMASLPGWWRQQAIKLHADQICGSRFVACLGADCVLCKRIEARHLFSGGRPILYYNQYPGGEKHHEYERGRLANVARVLQVEPARSSIWSDFIMDFMVMERQTLERLREYLCALYGPDPFSTILPRRCDTLEEKQQCGEQTLYAAFLLDVLRAEVRLENSANRFVAQVHSRREFDRFHFDAHAVHFVDKSLEVASILCALGLPPN